MKASEDAETKRLPQRSTRGKRLRAQLDDEEEADADFWNQEFFAEDAGDDDYVSEREEEDVPDSDFYESESEEGDEEVEVRKEPKKKALKAPGAPPARPKAPQPAAPKPPKPPSSPSAAAAAELSQALLYEATYEAPTLRKSTQKRVEEAKREREQRDQIAKQAARPKKQGDNYVMTQEELLAEAARTELENLASLKVLVAQEEETKRKANVKKQRFGGPLVKLRSKANEVLLPQAAPIYGQQQPAAFPAVAAPGVVDVAVAYSPGGTAAPPVSHAAVTPGSSPGPAVRADAAATVQQPHTAGEVAVPAVQPAASVNLGTAVAGITRPDAAALAKGTIDSAGQPAAGEQQPSEAQQQQEQQEQQPTGLAVVKQEITTLQCCGMKAPLWLQPQRARPPAGKPLCAITGVVARYRDPATGYPYASAAAFRELRRRLGQPMPDPKPRSVDVQAIAAATTPHIAGQALAGSDAADGYPCGQIQLQQLLAQQLQQQQAAAATQKALKGRGSSSLCYQQLSVPDEVAALVVSISPTY